MVKKLLIITEDSFTTIKSFITRWIYIQRGFVVKIGFYTCEKKTRERIENKLQNYKSICNLYYKLSSIMIKILFVKKKYILVYEIWIYSLLLCKMYYYEGCFFFSKNYFSSFWSCWFFSFFFIVMFLFSATLNISNNKSIHKTINIIFQGINKCICSDNDFLFIHIYSCNV